MHSASRSPLRNHPSRLSGGNSVEEDVAPPIPRFEGLPLLSLLAAALASLMVNLVTPSLAFHALAAIDTEGSVGPLNLSFFTASWLETLGGLAVLSIITLALHVVQQRRPFPNWVPCVCSLPITGLLVAPSALEFGGSWLAWLVVVLIIAAVFCVHWRVFTRARTIWD
jgi:hypothetical protein